MDSLANLGVDVLPELKDPRRSLVLNSAEDVTAAERSNTPASVRRTGPGE
jgi:hypothetical protein